MAKNRVRIVPSIKSFHEYLIDEQAAMDMGYKEDKAKELVKKNKAKLNMIIIDKLLHLGSVQALKLLYGILNIPNPEKVYGIRTVETNIDSVEPSIKIEVTTKDVQDNIEKL